MRGLDRCTGLFCKNGFYDIHVDVVDGFDIKPGLANIAGGVSIHIWTKFATDWRHNVHHQLKGLITAAGVFEHA